MANAEQYLDEVNAAPKGPKIAALFDFDGTIIAGYSATALLQEKIKRREMSGEEFLETINVTTQYARNKIGFSGLMAASVKSMKGVTEQSYVEFGEELYEKYLAQKVYPEARRLIEAHRAKGHTVAIVSSATIYQIAPTARDLDIEHIMCSQYEVENGEFTGNIIRPLCFGQGKVEASEKLAKQTGADLDKSFFYTDSDDDIELLERIGKPRVVNPNRKLAAIAEDRNWPVERFNSRGRATAVDVVRSVYASTSMIGTMVAGLPIWALTGSKREGANFTTGLYGDVASALAGITLDTSGEENAWAQRPAIFLFNHQSNVDPIIVSKIVRKDFGGVGKKEIGDIPIFGKLVKNMTGTVFVDRKNSKDAIKAMEPLINALTEEEKSVIMAPEGTRTSSTKLNPFKKGAFHLALKTGAPIVPIVIHNSLDVVPKGAFVMRPATVKVDILEPIDTSDWKRATLNDHVRDVRNLFLRKLGQSEEKAPAKKKTAAKKTKVAAKKTTRSRATNSSKKRAQPKKANRKTSSKRKPSTRPKKGA